MEKRIRAALVGFGMSGRVFHAPFLHSLPQYQWVAVVERNQKEAEKTYPYVETERSFDALLHREDIDLVIITTPNETHFPYVMQALAAGKHVVVEKPFAVNTNEALKMVAAAKESGKILSVYHNRRYVGDFKTICQIVNNGLLGTVHEYICHFDRFRDAPKSGKAWREEALPGSGILFDLGPHLIDQALFLFGAPHSVAAFIKTQRPFALADDYFEVRLDYNSGLTVILKAGMLVREMGPRYAVHGGKGSYIKYGDDPQEALLKQGAMPAGANWGIEQEHQYGILHTTLNGEVVRKTHPTLPGNYGTFYNNLFNTIRLGAPLMEKPEHGFNTIRLIELALESSAQKKTINITGLM